ncbi:uncharacterized protein LOC109810401 isoform X2 [Cajanus cajan]|uniref:uncharacterized protein LOC109810401 isoform X2 n=1 Tax=Cajanus cajan TaxID=3821 RepID=UPI0010FB5E13|nr:uncharacterized protein LOC109810401 isoform X2 [Cajanus cajan]
MGHTFKFGLFRIIEKQDTVEKSKLGISMSWTRPFQFQCSVSFPFWLWNKTRVLLTHHYRYHRHSSLSNNMAQEGVVSLQEWQGWGTTSPLPTMVAQIVEDLKVLEEDLDAHMSFGGNGGKLQGNFRVQEDKKHRATYQALGDSEKKLQFYSARQIACRILGSRGYLCQKCWLPMEDCMCSKVTSCTLYPGMKFWLYMHPKDFLRQNNTGKILWQGVGGDAATLCIFCIPEHEEIMWNSFKMAGKSNVWCLYPNKSVVLKSVQNVFGQESVTSDEVAPSKLKVDTVQHFIFIDGTWSNSAAMFRRLQDKAKLVWGDEDLACISLNPGASSMHKLRSSIVFQGQATAVLGSYMHSGSCCWPALGAPSPSTV